MSEPLPTSFTWRGITLDRVIHTERIGSAFDFGGGRTVERPSNPPVFSGTVGCWRYTLERQANATWIGKIYLGGAHNLVSAPYADFVTALDFAAEWWASVVTLIPEREA